MYDVRYAPQIYRNTYCNNKSEKFKQLPYAHTVIHIPTMSLLFDSSDKYA